MESARKMSHFIV